MRSPTLDELPSPPPGKTGWPWTEAIDTLPETMPDGQPWSKVSIVTPSYNQGQFLEETIRSVLLQGYPNLEYVVIDGGSTDGSVEIIRQYEKWLAYWVSEKDRGQAEAINKGFKRATGEICAWLNSDDVYEPRAATNAVLALTLHPDAAFVYSDCYFTDVTGTILHLATSHTTDLDEMLLGNVISQPTVFYGSQFLRSVGFLSQELRYAMDFDLWLRILRKKRAVYTPGVTARFRLQSGSKSVSQEHAAWAEMISLLESQKPSDEQPARVETGIALACMMAGWAYVYDSAQYQRAAEYFHRARDLGLFAPKNLPLAAKRSQAFLSLKGRLDSPSQTVEQLLDLVPELDLPNSFWNWLSAITEIEKAEASQRQQQWNLLQSQIVRALRIAPALAFEKSVWPLVLCGLLGPKWLHLAVKVKHALGSIFDHRHNSEPRRI